MHGLDCLDDRFAAVYRAADLASLFPQGRNEWLINRGVLRAHGTAGTLHACVCELRRPTCHAVLEMDDAGRLLAYCNEHGSPIEVSADAQRLYRFDWQAWAGLLKESNKLAGPTARRGIGCLHVGTGTVAGHLVHVVLVAPGRRRSAEISVPDAARAGGATVLLVVLGHGPMGPFDAPTIDWAHGLRADLVSLASDGIEEALRGVPLMLPDNELTHVCYTHDTPRGRTITSQECERLRARGQRAKFGLFIDLLTNVAWRSGRSCNVQLDQHARSTGKRLGQKALRLLADYVKRPGRPMAPARTPTYERSVADARTAATALALARRSVRLDNHLRQAARSTEPGEGTYVFEPGGLTYCVVEAARSRR